MMTQPIQKFQGLASETTPAGGNDLNGLGFEHDDGRGLEQRARYERAAMLTGALLWLGRQSSRLVESVKANRRIRVAEDQLYRMSDRELADIGLSRAEIPFAIRQAAGATPAFRGATGAAGAANQNLRHAA